MRTSTCFMLIVAVFVTLAGGVAHGETTQCKAITSFPATIAMPGIYCLESDFQTNLPTGRAITIKSNSVTLDLNGHTISNLAAGMTTQAVGIYGYRRQAVTVKNGTIVGFAYAVYMTDKSPYETAQANLVEDIRAYRNTIGGITMRGHGCIVRGNQIITTGVAPTGSNSAFGVSVDGPGNRVIDNDIVTVIAGDFGSAEGIFFGQAGENGVAIGNRITDSFNGIVMGQATTKYRDNVTTGVAMPYVGGTDAGNND
jgi:hypothetical protein